MYSHVKCLIIVFVCVGGYKITTVPNGSSEDTYSLLVSNQSAYDQTANEFEPESIEFQRKSSTIDDVAADVRSEALIKKIHPFVYPKQFNKLERMPAREYNATTDNLLEIRNMELNQQTSERIDDTYGSDHKHTTGDILPLPTHLSKHGHFHYGYFDRPHYHHPSPLQHGHNCLLGLLQGTDLSLLLLGILGFVAYVINAVLGLVDRLNLPLLGPAMAATGMATAAVTAAPITKTLLAQRHSFDDRTVESHQRLLKDFERILQMAIEVYEQKMNSI